jgi:hypothetical protein
MDIDQHRPQATPPQVSTVTTCHNLACNAIRTQAPLACATRTEAQSCRAMCLRQLKRRGLRRWREFVGLRRYRRLTDVFGAANPLLARKACEGMKETGTTLPKRRYIGCGAAVCHEGPELQLAQARLHHLRESAAASRSFASSVLARRLHGATVPGVSGAFVQRPTDARCPGAVRRRPLGPLADATL